MKRFEIDFVANEAQEHIAKKPMNAIGWGVDVRISSEQEVNIRARMDRKVPSP